MDLYRFKYVFSLYKLARVFDLDFIKLWQWLNKIQIEIYRFVLDLFNLSVNLNIILSCNNLDVNLAYYYNSY